MKSDSGEQREKLTRRRQMEVANMRRSLTETIPVGVYNTARAEPLLAAVKACSGAGVPHPFSAVAGCVLARALSGWPVMHGRIEDEHLVTNESVNLGVAVSGPDGSLVVPVIQDAHLLTAEEFGNRLRDMRERVVERKLRPEHVKGGGFTLSNVGMVMSGGQGMGVIPPGQGGLLVVGGVMDMPVAENGSIRAGKVLPLSLTFDHRLVNGMEAWRFFAAFIGSIEDPASVGIVP